MANKKPSKNDILSIELTKLEDKVGALKPKTVVDAARKSTHPLHKYFTWEDTRAAELYRLWEARNLIASVKVEFMGRQTDQYWSASFKIDKIPQKGYFSVDEVMNKEAIYAQVLESALSELEYWQKKFSHLKEIRGLINKKKLVKIKARKYNFA